MNGKTASVKTAQGVELTKLNGDFTADKQKNGSEPAKEPGSLTVVAKKKMSVSEKLDCLGKLEAIASKVEYLREKKLAVDKFGKGTNGFSGAKLVLEAPGCDDVEVSNPAICEELLSICKIRLKDLVIKAEKEVEDFEIV